MFLTTLLVLSNVALAKPSPPPPTVAVTTCFGPCYIPGCPNSTFNVCHETSGHTRIKASDSVTRAVYVKPNNSTGPVGVIGAAIHPAPPHTWGSVSGCGDIHGGC